MRHEEEPTDPLIEGILDPASEDPLIRALTGATDEARATRKDLASERKRRRAWMVVMALVVASIAVLLYLERETRERLGERERVVATAICEAANENREATRSALFDGVRGGFDVLVAALVGENPDPETVAEADAFFVRLDAILEQAREDLALLDCDVIIEGSGMEVLTP